MISRYREGEANRIARFLEHAVLPDLKAKLEQRLKRIKERGYDLGPATTKRLNALYSDLDDIIAQGHALARGETVEGLVALARQEAAFAAKSLETALPNALNYTASLPPPAVLRSIVTSRPFEGRVLSEWYGRQTANLRHAVRKEISTGIAQGETIDQMTRRLRHAMDGDIAGTRAIVRTATNHVTSHASHATMRENSEVYDGWKFLATLDQNTTLECAGLDGTVYELDDTSKLPPRHYGCRSVPVGELKSYADLGFPDIEDTDPVSRAALGGPVPGNEDYQGWLQRMDKDPKTRHYVDDALGPQRADMWRSGVHVKRFSTKGGETLTVEQVARKEGIDVPKRRRREKAPSG